MLNPKTLWLKSSVVIAIVSLLVLLWVNPAFLNIYSVGQGAEVNTSQPFAVPLKDQKGKLVVELDYSYRHNPVLIIEPKDSCITRISLTPAAPAGIKMLPYVVSNNRFCNQQIISIARYLYVGVNELHLEVESKKRHGEVYINPLLMGPHVASTLACVGLFIVAASLLFHLVRRTGLSKTSAAIVVAGMGYFLFWLHFHANLTNTNDLPGHIQYIRYMVGQWMHPYAYNGWESFQPPPYYFIMGRIYDFFSAPGLISPLTALRLCSLVLYLTFCIFALRCLREAVEEENIAYYIGNILIVFWPVGMLMATRINNDIALYAAWAATFYYLVRGYKHSDAHSLYMAIGLTGLALMVKSNGYVLGGIVASCILYAMLTGRIAGRTFLRHADRNLAVAALLLGMLVNAGRLIYKTAVEGEDASHLHFGGAKNDPASVMHFLTFDPWHFIRYPFITFGDEPGFWNYFLKTFLYGEFRWRHDGILTFLPAFLNILLVLFLLITIGGMIRSLWKKHTRLQDAMPYLAGIVLPTFAMIAFMSIKQWMVGQEFRYCLPMLIPLVIVFVHNLESFRIAGLHRLYSASAAVGILLPLGAIVLYLSQYIAL